MKRSKNNINHRLNDKKNHIGGSMISNMVNPLDISDEEIKRKRAIREDKEDMDAAFRNY